MCSNTIGASNHKPLTGVTTMAGTQHTQTYPKFTWLFLATREALSECSPVVLRCDADSEEDARAIFPEWHLTFAAKIRTESPYSFTWTDKNRATLWSIMGGEISLPLEARNV
ncbi:MULTISPECIES: host cell division inhibitor Icd-like protein [Klebsiella]|uniref:host cell division inhibitor Icd-like protein n=1 Tax=Klebsiella TaxID=570 RepID=UPI0027952ADA|nr:MULTISPECIES: host cell division inhibitor Icd-like protein [Klebsiella]MDW5835226.1 host cell division inhibitor Icd-like protein [Klebsiella pneumoniae]